jgi:acetate kinase
MPERKIKFVSNAILVLNSGSSSIKYALYESSKLECIDEGKLEFTKVPSSNDYKKALQNIVDRTTGNILAVGHRIVHGGRQFTSPAFIDKDVQKKLHSLIALAPLHQPFNLLGVEMMQKVNPKCPQIACFDTAFHSTQALLSQLYAIPKPLSKEGIIRYGFHGLSYEYIVSKLPQYTDKSQRRVIVAHLGNGASLCAIEGLKSKSSTMGFTALEGLMMGTRCGQLDPGIILYLLEQKNMSPKEIENILYKKSGLLGVSGISSDIRELLKSRSDDAKVSIDLFCHYVVKAIGQLTAELEGLDVLVFTAGIGENQAVIREKICSKLKWLCINVDENANNNNERKISTNHSAIDVLVVPTNEEKVIAHHTKNMCKI